MEPPVSVVAVEGERLGVVHEGAVPAARFEEHVPDRHLGIEFLVSELSEPDMYREVTGMDPTPI
jgi:hypothetical protein